MKIFSLKKKKKTWKNEQDLLIKESLNANFASKNACQYALFQELCKIYRKKWVKNKWNILYDLDWKSAKEEWPFVNLKDIGFYIFRKNDCVLPHIIIGYGKMTFKGPWRQFAIVDRFA